MKKKSKTKVSSTSNTRHKFVLGIFCVVALSLLASAFNRQVVEEKFLKTQGNNRVLRTQEIPAVRGMILDRNHESLAVSTEVHSVWADPFVVLDYPEYFPELAQILSMDLDKLKEILNKRPSARFVWVKRQLPPYETNDIIRLNLPGIYIEKEYKRFYPDAEITAQLLGFTNSADEGLEGLELTFDAYLKGKPGRKQVVRDSKNRIIDQFRLVEEAEPGNNLELTIDRRIQLVAYQALKNAVDEHEAKSGSVIVADAWTGDILALVSQPAGNPNNVEHRIPELMKNRAISDVFEPGSTIKPFVVALGLESKQWTPTTVIQTGPQFVINGNPIKDVAKSTTMDVTTVLVKSSNIGVAKIALSMSPDVLWNLYQNFGIGKRSSLGIVGEQVGTLGHLRDWQRNSFEHATKSFGYGISVNTVQLTQMFSVFSNKGVMMPLRIVKDHDVNLIKEEPKRIYSKAVTSDMVMLLEKVISDNPNSKAKVAHYRVGGKSGTARKIEHGRYSNSKHRAFYAGFAPVSDPRYVVVVMIDEPSKGQYYGGLVAAPVFSEVMGNTLHILKVKPDGLVELPKLQLISNY